MSRLFDILAAIVMVALVSVLATGSGVGLVTALGNSFTGAIKAAK
jgi:hypothetical protein